MMESFRVRMEMTRKRTIGLSPECFMKVRPEMKSSLGKHIQSVINCEGLRLVRNYLHAEGITRIDLAENPKRELGINKLEELSAGDWDRHFNPAYFKGPKDPNMLTKIEHDLWHIYIIKVFPTLNMDIATLGGSMYDSYPSITEHFLEPFAHFWLRSAALEGGSFGFAVKDSKSDLSRFLSRLSETGKKNGSAKDIERAIIYCGTLFSTVLPFRIEKRWESFEKEHNNMILSEAVRSKSLDVHKPAQKFTDEIYDAIVMRREDKNDLQTEGLSSWMPMRWMDFLRQ